MPRLGATADEVRARVPAVLEAYVYTRDHVLRSGIVDRALKEVCFRYLAGDVLESATGRERVALEWARAIAYDPALADDDLWSRSHAHFTEPELVELGCAIGFELGYQHWRRTLGLPARD